MLAMPLDGKAPAPVVMPDIPASSNRSVRAIEARFDAAGKLELASVEIHYGVAAERLRRALRGHDQPGRLAHIQSELRERVSDAEIVSLAVEGLDEDGAELTLRYPAHAPPASPPAPARGL